MIDKFVVIPYGCRTQFTLTSKVGVMVVTDSISVYNEHKDLPTELIDTIKEVTGVNERKQLTCVVDLALVIDGRIVKSTKPYIDITNNILLGLYKHDFTIFELMESYGYDSFLIDKKIDIDYTDILVRMVDKYINIFKHYSTIDKTLLSNVDTFKEKLYTLIDIISEPKLGKLHFIGTDDFIVHNQMVYDFAILDSVFNNKELYTAWSITKRNYELAGLLTGTDKNVTPLAIYAYDILVKSLDRLVELELDEGTNPSIVSIGGSKYFDIDKKMILNTREIGRIRNEQSKNQSN